MSKDAYATYYLKLENILFFIFKIIHSRSLSAKMTLKNIWMSKY